MLSRFLKSNHGFSLIELMVAIAIMAIGGVMLATVSLQTSSAQSKAKIRERQNAIAQGLYERLHGDQNWTKYCGASCNPYTGLTPAQRQLAGTANVASGNCPPKDPFVPGPGFDRVVDKDLIEGIDTTAVGYCIRVTATRGYTSQTIANFAPFAVPPGTPADFFRIVIEVAIDQNTPAASFGLKPITVGGSTTSRQTATTGSVEVQVCRLTGNGTTTIAQIDERYIINDCSDNGATGHDLMMKFPTACNLVTPTKGDCPAWFVGAVTSGLKYIQTHVQPMPGFNVTVSGGGTKATLTDGRIMFRDVPLGQRAISVTPPAGYRVWASHSYPTDDSVTVQAGVTSRATIVLAPVPVRYTLRIQTLDVSDPVVPVLSWGAKSNFDYKMVSAPYGRTQLAYTWVHVLKGAMTTDAGGPPGPKTELEQGLYSPYVVLGPATRRTMQIYSMAGTPLNYLWIQAPVATNSVPISGQAVIRYTYCDPVRRGAVIATRCEQPYTSALTCWYRKADDTRIYLDKCDSTELAGGAGDGGT